MKGVGLDSEGWLPLVVGKPDRMSCIKLFGTEEGWAVRKKENLSLDEHKALAAGLADTVRNVHARFLKQRKNEIAEGKLSHGLRREPIDNSEKIGAKRAMPLWLGQEVQTPPWQQQPAAPILAKGPGNGGKSADLAATKVLVFDSVRTENLDCSCAIRMFTRYRAN